MRHPESAIVADHLYRVFMTGRRWTRSRKKVETVEDNGGSKI